MIDSICFGAASTIGLSSLENWCAFLFLEVFEPRLVTGGVFSSSKESSVSEIDSAMASVVSLCALRGMSLLNVADCLCLLRGMSLGNVGGTLLVGEFLSVALTGLRAD